MNLTGVEKLNDVCRKIHLSRSNKWDASKDILFVEKRLDNLKEHDRDTRSYDKKKVHYWEGTIKESRSKRQRVSTVTPEVSLAEASVRKLKIEEIKQKLTELGVQTKLKSRNKLEDLLVDTLFEKENVLLH